MMNSRKYKIFIFLALSLCLGSLFQLCKIINDGIIRKVSVAEKHRTPQQRKVEKLVTIFTTFVDDTNLPNFECRNRTQSNFLRMTSWDCFRENANFIIFTNSHIRKLLIRQKYPHVLAVPSILRGDFNTPMLKDLFLIAGKLYPSLFYMFANADNLYDSSLMQTLFHVKRAWETGRIRQKVLIVGQRRNVIIQEAVENENIFHKYFQKSNLFTTDAQDYFIVTKDSFEWEVFPELLLGRRAYDNMMVDLGVHNEVEVIDATSTIRLIHQDERGTDHSSFDRRNSRDNSWNWMLAKFQISHWSTSCARYRTEYDEISVYEVNLYDKKTKMVLDLSERTSQFFANEHEYWVKFSEREVHVPTALPPSLVVAVLAYNKPDSLMRLLRSLEKIGSSTARIDLIISLDIGYLGYYDIPTLEVAKKFEWLHGRKKLVLKDKHRGQLHQWLEAYSHVDSNKETPFLILEDCMVLSPRWYDYLRAVLSHRVQVLQYNIVGWSLEIPILWQSPRFVVNMFYKDYARKSSLVLGGIKRVRSFIPNIEIWKEFVEWFLKESKNIPSGLLSNTLAAQLENRGTYTHWESEMWVTWFSYYVEMNYPQHQKIGYVLKRSGFLANKLHMSINDKSRKKGGCYTHEVLTSEMKIRYLKNPIKNESILIPNVIPTFRIEPIA